MRISLKIMARNMASYLRRNQMLRHSALLFVGYVIAHILNTIYQMVVSRTLPANEYALLAAFVGALLIVQYPLMTLTTALSRFSSLLVSSGHTGDVRRLFSRWLYRSAFAGLICSVLGIWFRHEITAWLHIDRSGPVVVAALSIPAFLMLPIVLGVSQGIQRFGWNAGTTILGSTARLLCGSLFVLLLYPSSGWGLLGHGLGTWVNVIALVFGLYCIFRSIPVTDNELPHLRLFLLQSGLAQLAYATLMTADVVLVKHFIPAEESFAYAATLGRLTVFLSSTIVIAMFPKVTTSGRITPEQYTIFKQSLLYTAICVSLTIFGTTLFPGILLRILFGIRSPSSTLRAMTIGMTIIMGLSALLNTCLQFLVAQKRFLPTGWVLIAAVGYLLASTFFHQSTWHILAWAAIATIFSLMALLPACIKSNPERKLQEGCESERRIR